jgi:low affinity Fe/Cu permease
MRRPAASLTITGGDPMLYTIAVILIVLWLLGLVTGYTMGYFIHILLVIAIVIVLVRIIQGRRPI